MSEDAAVDQSPKKQSYLCDCGERIFAVADQALMNRVVAHARSDCQKARGATLTPAQVNALTLGELESMAARFGAAVATIKEAQALLGAPAAAPVSVVSTAPAAAPVSRIPERPPSRIDPEAQQELDAFRMSQERNRLVAQNRDDPGNFPGPIANAMRGQ